MESVNKIRKFFLRYEYVFVFSLGALLVVLLAFFGGLLYAKKIPSAPIIVERPITSLDMVTSNDRASQEVSSSGPIKSNLVGNTECLYVGSKNSTKYYPPTCRFAKRIKPENMVCFNSDTDAQNKGYSKSTGC